jgi:hypothetical protein
MGQVFVRPFGNGDGNRVSGILSDIYGDALKGNIICASISLVGYTAGSLQGNEPALVLTTEPFEEGAPFLTSNLLGGHC